MAEIEMERRPRRTPWIWLGIALLVIVLAVGAWFLWARGTTGVGTSPAAERPPVEDPITPPATDPYWDQPVGAPQRPDTPRGTQPQP
jgi:hypothetical protein